MAKITQRDIAESVSGLRGVALDLIGTADSGTPPGAPDGTVLANGRSLREAARYLQDVAEELLNLITDRKVVIPPDNYRIPVTHELPDEDHELSDPHGR